MGSPRKNFGQKIIMRWQGYIGKFEKTGENLKNFCESKKKLKRKRRKRETNAWDLWSCEADTNSRIAKGIITFEPEAEPKNHDDLQEIYELQKFA